MRNELTLKIIRGAIITLIFLAMLSLAGIVDMRKANQIVFMLTMMGIFSLLVKNIWVTLFMCWAIFLYSYYKFFTGHSYVTNIFLGSVLYFITKVGFKKENINLFINAFLWFVFANLVLAIFQVCGYDFVFSGVDFLWDTRYIENTNFDGFMGHKSILGSLIALAIPILATRGTKWSWIGAIGLFLPLYLCKTSLCFLAGIIGLLFILYFKIPKKIFGISILVLVLCSSFYMNKVDSPGFERFAVWKKIMRDAKQHPIVGWGLDSFRNITKQKNFLYANQVMVKSNYHKKIKKGSKEDIIRVDWWDNPHNLLISLFYEFGGVGVILFIGLIRKNVLRFVPAIKNNNTIALASFGIVFLVISMGHFPIYLARMACFIIPFFALYEVQTA